MTEFKAMTAPQGSRDKSTPRTLQRVASKEGSRSRSAHGCWTCRLRRKKCDENGPECVTCTDRGLKCSGFGAIKPGWMDGGSQQEVVHREIKATVASVTRMKRMLKLVQAREKASPGRRSASIPADAFDNVNNAFYRHGSFSSDIINRAASVGPALYALPPSDTPQWTTKFPCDWIMEGDFNTIPFENADVFANLHPEIYTTNMEHPIPSQNSLVAGSAAILPTHNETGHFYHYSTPEPESYAASTISTGTDPTFNIMLQQCVFPPSPTPSIPALDHSDPSIRIPTPCRVQEVVYCHGNEVAQASQSEGGGISKTLISSRKAPLSPVCELSSLPALAGSALSRLPPLLPKAECPRPCNQVNIPSLERSAIQASLTHPAVAFARAQILRTAAAELARLRDLLHQNVNPHLRVAISWVLRVRDEFLIECESHAARVLSEPELASLGALVRFVVWTDITTRTFDGPEVESPFRGHISRLLEAIPRASQQNIGPVEDWIFTGIESVTRLAQMRAQLVSEGLFDLREFQYHESTVLSNLEYRLNADDSSSQDKLPNTQTILRRSIFLHSIMIYFYVTVQEKISENIDIRKNVDIIIRDLLALNNSRTLSAEFAWPFLVAASMAGPEHHQPLFDMLGSPFENPLPRIINVFQVVQEAWALRAQGVRSDWRIAHASLAQRGYCIDTACW